MKLYNNLILTEDINCEVKFGMPNLIYSLYRVTTGVILSDCGHV